MIDTDKYENMRQLFLDFIDTASDEVDEEAWKNRLTMLDELLAEVKQLREETYKLREETYNWWEMNGELRRQVEELKDDLEDWLAGDTTKEVIE